MGARLRFAAGLRGFLAEPLAAERCRRIVVDGLASRERSFLALMERAIWSRPRSPYLALMRHAGVERADVEVAVRSRGVEAALDELERAGVRLSLDEFKGRVPIRRGSLDLDPGPHGFDNPLPLRHYVARTSGSTGQPSRINIALGLLNLEAAHERTFLESLGILDSAYAMWRAVPPGLSGLKTLLRHGRIGLPIEAWLTPYRPGARPGELSFHLLLAAVLAAGRLAGPGAPRPRLIEPDRAVEVAMLLSALRAGGRRPVLDAPWSSAVQVSNAAVAEGIEITGTLFRCGGEPASEQRAAAIAASGSDHATSYSMGEVGRIGVPCRCREGLDDVHLLTDKVALLGGGARGSAEPILLTTIAPSCPKLLVNVDVGDSAEVLERDCDCLHAEAGYRTVLRGIFSHDKLTAGGMQFTAAEIAGLLERELPARLGGEIGDYQLVHRVGAAPARLELAVGAGRDELSDERIVSEALVALASLGEAQRMMASNWRGAGTLRVLRRAPFATGGGKVQHLHRLAAEDRSQ